MGLEVTRQREIDAEEKREAAKYEEVCEGCDKVFRLSRTACPFCGLCQKCCECPEEKP